MNIEHIERNSNQQILEIIRQKDIECLSSMYPNISETEMENKYKLFVDFELYFPYLFDNIYADIIILTNDKSVSVPTYKIRRPFYNKNWNIVSMRNKQRLSQRGVPILFESFEDLSAVNEIIFNWIVEKEGLLQYALQISYYPTFKQEKGKTFYGIYNYDMPLITAIRLDEKDGKNNQINPLDYILNHQERLYHIIDEYDGVAECTGSDDNDVQLYSEFTEKDIRSLLTLILRVNVGCEKHNVKRTNKSLINLYSSNIELQPFTETRMLPCYYAYKR